MIVPVAGARSEQRGVENATDIPLFEADMAEIKGILDKFPVAGNRYPAAAAKLNRVLISGWRASPNEVHILSLYVAHTNRSQLSNDFQNAKSRVSSKAMFWRKRRVVILWRGLTRSHFFVFHLETSHHWFEAETLLR